MCYYLDMNFIVGLGNPGLEYEQTRHNLGFMMVDRIAEKWQLQFSAQKRCQAEITKKDSTMLVKPQTFMNNSGEAVQAILKYYGNTEVSATAEYPNLFVVFDDLDLEVGHYKIQLGTGPKIHNGTASIYAHLKTHQFWHVRIGADNRKGDRTLPATQYVLGKFSPEEKLLLRTVFSDVILELENRVK
ncbi:aminoacyl-tRNA hydrolase [soil metagenome]